MSASVGAHIDTAKRNGRRAAVTSNFNSLAEVQKAMLKKLSDSLLTAADAKQLGLKPFTAQDVAAQLKELTFMRAGFKIPYFTLQGKRSTFYRFRYLEYDNGHGFTKLIHTNGNGALKHDIRYVQPANTLPQVYFPPTIPWDKVAKNNSVILTITEGELKAACACKLDIPTIGLGGVWSFKSNAQQMHLLPVLREFVWEGRTVYICYDSDAVTNPNVCAAENALAHELTNLGALVYICRLPSLGSGKTGLDDYLAQRGKEDFEKNIRAVADGYRACEELFKLNGEVVYVRDPGVVMRMDNLQRITPRAFVEHQYANRIWYAEVSNGENGTKLVEKSAPREWLKWPHRATVERVTYKPGDEQFTASGELNVWPRWGCEPAKGDVSLWLDYLEYIFADHEDKDFRIKWFQQWLAYPLKRPGTKLNQSVVMWSVDQGTGKSVIGYVMQQIYGRNFTEISDKHLQGNFNEWAENRQFVMGDEIASTGDKRRDTADRMKSMITQRELRLNPKYIPSYTVPDCINYYFTSNHCDAFFVDDTDRRFFINEIKRRPRPADWYRKFCDWTLHGGTGASAIFQHLLDFDVTDFDPQGHAPTTTSKQEMIDSSRTDAASWVAKLREDPDYVLRVGDVVVPYKLWTADDLFRIYDPEGRGKLSINGLARELRRGGFKRLRDGSPIRTMNGLLRLWAIRDVDAMLLLQQPKWIAKQYADERNNKAKGSKY